LRFSFTLGKYEVNLKDSSVIGRVWEMARLKAIYRQGLGCTLVNDIDEPAFRKQSIILGRAFKGNPDSIPWPDGDLLPDSFPARLYRNALNSAVDAAFALPDSTKKPRTRAVVVVYDGQLVGKYASGFDIHSPCMDGLLQEFCGVLDWDTGEGRQAKTVGPSPCSRVEAS
jgi:hypothetical protein